MIMIPSSIFYGQLEPGGLVNMVTKKPTVTPLFELAADTDQEGSTRFLLDAGGALNAAESLRYRSTLVKQDVNYHINDDWQISLSYNKQTFERQRFESAPKKPKMFKEGDEYTSKPYDRFDDWQFTTKYIDITGEFELAGLQHNLLIGANSLNYYYGQLRVKSTPITYSAGQVEPEKPNVNYKDDDTLYSSQYDYYGFYLQDLVTINPQWQVSLGGRYDKQNKKGADNETALPKFGVLYHPSEYGTIYYSYSEGFQPQSSNKLKEETDINDGMKLKAISSKQSEIGVNWQLVDDRLLLSGALFDISKSGTLITESIEHPQYETRTTQAGEQRHKGFELAAQGAVTDKFFLMTSLINIDAKYEQDQRYQGKTPVDVPKWSAAIWSRYEVSEQLSFNAGAFYEGERFADSDNTIGKDAYTRVDVGATYQMMVQQYDLNLRFNINNLFDKKYLIGGGTNNVTAADGIGFRVAAQLSF